MTRRRKTTELNQRETETLDKVFKAIEAGPASEEMQSLQQEIGDSVDKAIGDGRAPKTLDDFTELKPWPTSNNNNNNHHTESESTPSQGGQLASVAGELKTTTSTSTSETDTSQSKVEVLTVQQLVDMLNELPTKSAKIRLLTQLGYSRGNVAKLLGISYQHVYNVLNTTSAKEDNPNPRGHVSRAIEEVFAKTKSVTITAKETGKPYQQVYQTLLKAGLIKKGERATAQRQQLTPIDLMTRLKQSYANATSQERRTTPIEVHADAFQIEDLSPFEQGLTHHPECRCSECRSRDEAILKELESQRPNT